MGSAAHIALVAWVCLMALVGAEAGRGQADVETVRGVAHKGSSHARHQRSGLHNHRSHEGPRPKPVVKSGVVQYSPSANKYFFTPSALTYTGHEDTVVAAWGSFNDSLHASGWGELTLTTSGKVRDEVQAYAGGYIEGALTAQRIYELFVVIHDVHAKKPEVGEFIRAQDRFIRSKIKQFDVAYAAHQRAAARGAMPPPRPMQEHASLKSAAAAVKAAAAKATASGAATTATLTEGSGPRSSDDWSEFELVYWFNVKLVMAQFDGLLAGYNRHRNPRTTKPLTAQDLWLVNDDGDILDIERAVSPGRVFSNPSAPARQELIELLSYNSRCSVLVKWTGNDLLAGHATWDDYNEMNRIYKFYHFKFSEPLHAHRLHSQRLAMSSYPGMIFSSDDFYVLDSGLVLLETTLNILNEQLYQHSDPQSTVMAWIRNLVANRLASNGAEWSNVFGHYNSGTYNNQWMIVDYKLFNPKAEALAPGTLWLFEQIPGFTKHMDVTPILEKNKYWASYNRPFFQETNERSMFEHFANAKGATQQDKELFTYSQCPRAKIFAREADDVDDLDDLKAVLRLNAYETDEVSAGCPGAAIAARFDLPATSAKCEVRSLKPNGATDAKVTNAALAARLQAFAVGGPTDDEHEPFDWSKTTFKKPAGQPDLWDFDWKLMSPAPKFW